MELTCRQPPEPSSVQPGSQTAGHGPLTRLLGQERPPLPHDLPPHQGGQSYRMSQTWNGRRSRQDGEASLPTTSPALELRATGMQGGASLAHPHRIDQGRGDAPADIRAIQVTANGVEFRCLELNNPTVLGTTTIRHKSLHSLSRPHMRCMLGSDPSPAQLSGIVPCSSPLAWLARLLQQEPQSVHVSAMYPMPVEPGATSACQSVDR